MKLLSILVASIWAGTAAAQGIDIGFPPAGDNISAGQQLTIQVIKNNHIESSIEAGLVIGFLPCANFPSGCSPEDLGSILYNGPYNPQLQAPGQNYQNFTVTIPTSIPTGAAQIAIARFFLIGAGPSPTIGQANVTVMVQPSLC
ncbi:hypothetical protein BYT27DRAFT_7092512 [Phlegmacium glaucopus]|nr:hypothetical protein BYT27DRAFT_7092512 [Phlegmacium glaucopus]